MNRSSPLKRLGKKGKQWEKVRRDLVPRFKRAGITTCELGYSCCWRDQALGFAHAKKRRNLGPGELSLVILACNPCHDQIECLPEEEMGKIVRAIIEARQIQP